MVQTNHHSELARGAVAKVAALQRRPGDILHLSLNLQARQSIDLDVGGVTGRQVRAVDLSHPTLQFHLLHVKDLRHEAARLDFVSFAVFRQAHAGIIKGGLAILLHGHQPVHRRAQVHAFNVLFGEIHIQLGLGKFLLGDGDHGPVGGGMGRNIFLQLCEVPPRLVERQQVLLGVHGADQVLLAHFHLRPPDVELRL